MIPLPPLPQGHTRGSPTQGQQKQQSACWGVGGGGGRDVDEQKLACTVLFTESQPGQGESKEGTQI